MFQRTKKACVSAQDEAKVMIQYKNDAKCQLQLRANVGHLQVPSANRIKCKIVVIADFGGIVLF